MSARLFLDEVEQPHNHNPNSPPFSLLVDVFQKLVSVTGTNLDRTRFATVTLYREELFGGLIRHWRFQIGPDMYPAMRLILPNRDFRLYNIKNQKLNQLVVKLLNIPKDSDDYLRLYNWKKSYHSNKHHLSEVTADLPLLICKVLSVRRLGQPVKSSLTVAQINEAFDALVGISKTADQVALLAPLVDRMTIEEVRWFFHILLKDLILSMSETLFLRTYHPDAPDLFMLCNHLDKVVWALSDPAKRLTPAQLVPQLFYLFVPQSLRKLEHSYAQLCSKMIDTFTSPDQRLQDLYKSRFEGKFIVEEKLDGDRMLLHMHRENGHLHFKFFSRRRRDYSLLYGETIQFGTLTKYLEHAFGDYTSIILDGEMLAWDIELQKILPFGILKSANIQESVRQFTATDPFRSQGSQPLFIVFDILMLNGKDLTGLPLFYRKSLLAKTVTPVPHRLEIIDYLLVSTPEEITLAVQNVISAKSEGIMVKSCLSKYRVGIRSTTWVKVKPEYLELFGENLDLVVIGKTPGVKDAYMCGLVDLNTNTVKLFCNVANGFSFEEYSQINSATYGKWHEFAKNPPPADLEFGSRKPTYWINPVDSFVLEVKARSIDNQGETTYAAGLTLHNNWCRAIRHDKDHTTAETLQSYQIRKELALAMAMTVEQTVNRKHRRRLQDLSFQQHNIITESTSDLFLGLTFTVLSDKRDPHTKKRISVSDIKRCIKSNGGSFTDDPTSVKQVVVMSERMSPTTRAFLAAGFDIIRPSWVFECIRKHYLVPMEPSLVFRAVSNLFGPDRQDEYGDSYTVANHIGRPLVEYLGLLSVPRRLTAASSDFAQQAFLEESPTPLAMLFSRHTFHVAAGPNRLEAITRRIARYGGHVTQGLICDYVILSQPSTLDVEVFHRHDGSPSVIVTESFINACIDGGKFTDGIGHQASPCNPV